MFKTNIRIKRKHTPVIWAVALALSLVVFLSLVWLAPMIWDISEVSKNVIPLTYSGDRQIVTRNTLKYLAGEENPDVLVRDKDAVWEMKTDVDLFSSSYIGKDGSVTVESSNGDKIIAPGTSQDYRFSLKNTGNISLDYTMELASLFSLKSQDLPFRIRLRKGDEWIIGNETEWEKPEAANAVIERGTLDTSRSVEYIFEWLWPYEDETDNSVLLNDLNDVIAANEAVEHDVKFQLGITTVSTVTPGALPVDDSGTPMLEPLIRWNLFSHLVVPCVILLLTFPFLVAIYLPVSVNGKAPLFAGKSLYIGKRRCQIRTDGSFVFKRIRMGKQTIFLGTSEAMIRIKRRPNVDGIAFRTNKKGQILLIGMNIRALELSFWIDGTQLKVSEGHWRAFDKKSRVYVPQVRILPGESPTKSKSDVYISLPTKKR